MESPLEIVLLTSVTITFIDRASYILVPKSEWSRHFPMKQETQVLGPSSPRGGMILGLVSQANMLCHAR